MEYYLPSWKILDNSNDVKLKVVTVNLPLYKQSCISWCGDSQTLERADILTLLCDISQVNSRPIVPGPFHREVFNIIFNLPHPGRVILSGHVLCGIGNSRCPSMDTNLYVVPAAKIRRHTTVPLQRFDLPDGRFEDTHVDIITLYLHWSPHSLDWSDSHSKFESRILSPDPDGGLDLAIWHSEHHYVRSWCSGQSFVITDDFPRH